MENYNSHDEPYAWSEPSVTYMDDLRPLVAEEKALAASVAVVAASIAKAVCCACACTSSTNHAKYSQRDVMRDRTIRRILDV